MHRNGIRLRQPAHDMRRQVHSSGAAIGASGATRVGSVSVRVRGLSHERHQSAVALVPVDEATVNIGIPNRFHQPPALIMVIVLGDQLERS
jgi:hypothetical protein